MNNIRDALQRYTQAFKTLSDTPHLDAQLLIAHTTNLTRATLFAQPEKKLTTHQTQYLAQLAEKRLQGQPIAYLIEQKEFWGFPLKVTPNVLIPRPETECLVEWILNHYAKNKKIKVADLGVGSGAIALALAKERPHWIIHATDRSNAAITIAKENALAHRITNVVFFQGEWCSPLPNKDYDLIVSNPPYINSSDPHLKQLTFEPITALNGGKDGLEAIKRIVKQSTNYLKSGGSLILEHGYDQRLAILNLLNKNHHSIEAHDDLAGLPRYVTAKK